MSTAWANLLAHWSRILLTVLGGFELLMALSSGSTATLVVGVVGGLMLAAAPWAPVGRTARFTLVLVGAVPFAALTWWSLASPLLAIVAAALGITLARASAPQRARAPRPAA